MATEQKIITPTKFPTWQQKINPLWWLMNGDTFEAPAENNGVPYLPEIANPTLRAWYWWWRNPFANFVGFVLGVEDQERTIYGTAPVEEATMWDHGAHGCHGRARREQPVAHLIDPADRLLGTVEERSADRARRTLLGLQPRDRLPQLVRGRHLRRVHVHHRRVSARRDLLHRAVDRRELRSELRQRLRRTAGGARRVVAQVDGERGSVGHGLYFMRASASRI